MRRGRGRQSSPRHHQRRSAGRSPGGLAAGASCATGRSTRAAEGARRRPTNQPQLLSHTLEPIVRREVHVASATGVECARADRRSFLLCNVRCARVV
eukprot:14882503-Alexandrium_andersonii.AAC.1